jgi:hypothetical protein
VSSCHGPVIVKEMFPKAWIMDRLTVEPPLHPSLCFLVIGSFATFRYKLMWGIGISCFTNPNRRGHRQWLDIIQPEAHGGAVTCRVNGASAFIADNHFENCQIFWGVRCPCHQRNKFAPARKMLVADNGFRTYRAGPFLKSYLSN